MKRKRKLRIILYGGPWGFMAGKFPLDVWFTDRKRDASSVAGGEGNAFCFVLEDMDVTVHLAEALRDGRFLRDVQKGRWELRFIPALTDECLVKHPPEATKADDEQEQEETE